MSQISDRLVGADEFRKLMRRIASSVAVITTAHEGRLHGMTATAVSSISAEPPRLLVVINKTTRSHPLVLASKRFAVNILAESQQHLGISFSGKLENQFDGLDYRLTRHGLPVFDQAAVYFECALAGETDMGTHTIFIGDIIDGDVSDVAPLLYHDGAFKALAVR